MTSKREYSILPQGEKDEFHHHVRDGGSVFTPQYICLCTVITVVIFVILTGVTALTASVFYSDQISTTYKHFWYSYESISSNDTTSSTIPPDDSSFKDGSWSFLGGSRNKTASGEQRNSSDYTNKNNNTFDNFHHSHHIQHGIHNGGGVGSSNNYSDSESDSHDSMNTVSGNSTLNQTFEEESNSTIMDSTGEDIINVEELKAKFAEAMRDFEKHMENITGIRQAEFVVPIFMLICFLTIFSIISFCCCVMMRRRDNRRRKLFGKLITDLQTGDSKTVLLNHSDLDD